MYRFFFLSYVLFLGYQIPLVEAQTCNSTTGTYPSCCPSFDEKALTFQGREYRVHCDAELSPSSSRGATSPDDCAKNCTNQSPLWRFDTVRGRGRCECYSFDTTKRGRISFVPMDSEQTKDLAKCEAESKTNSDQVKACETKLGTCQAGLTTCQGQQGQSDKDCPGKLQLCQDDLSRIDKTCPSKLQQCKNDLAKVDKTCPGRLKTCNTALTKDNRELEQYKKGCPYLLAKCPQGKVKDSTNPCRCRPKPKKPTKKKPTKKKPTKKKPTKKPKVPLVDCKQRFKTIDGARYTVRCGNLPYSYLIGENPHSGHGVKNVIECARKCTNTKCLWLWYQPLEKKCFLRYTMWTTADTYWSKGNIDIVLQRWD